MPRNYNHKIADALHHLHVRKRVHQWLEKYPHPHWFKRFIDRLIYVVALAGPFFILPQVYMIWFEGKSDGVAIETWVGALAGSLVWLVYGILHKVTFIILGNIVWLIVTSLIVLGLLVA